MTTTLATRSGWLAASFPIRIFCRLCRDLALDKPTHTDDYIRFLSQVGIQPDEPAVVSMTDLIGNPQPVLLSFYDCFERVGYIVTEVALIA